jgi:hypothetical protein
MSAGFWNYLRQDITVALMEKRRLKIDLSNVSMGPPVEDDDRANMISRLLGIVINRCLGKDAPALGLSEWTSLQLDVEQWRRDLPRSFEPISISGPAKSSFPELFLLHGWHGMPKIIIDMVYLLLTIFFSSCCPAILPYSYEHPHPC